MKAKDDILQDAAALVADRTIKNLPIRSVALEFKDAATLDKAVKAGRVNVFYIAPGNADSLPQLLKMSHTYAITTATGVPEYVQRGRGHRHRHEGGQEAGHPHQPARPRGQEGSEFDASLLRIATVVK